MALQPATNYYVIASNSAEWRGNLLVQQNDIRGRITDEWYQSKPFIEHFVACCFLPGDCHVASHSDAPRNDGGFRYLAAYILLLM